MTIETRPRGVEALLAAQMPSGAVGLAWVGQSGFVLCTAESRVLLDVYLSNYLARKYAGSERPHERMMPAPIHARDLAPVDWVLCSHRHSDHMDPESLPTIASGSPHCRFVVPRAETESAIKAGIPPQRMVAVNAGESVTLAANLTLHVLASAHESFRTNERGEHSFLGFVLITPDVCLYHSGDCVPFPGHAEQVGAFHPDAALLPVNGRGRGVPGNMTLAEARELCERANIPVLIPHHFGMFAFNTIEPAELQREIATTRPALKCLLPTSDSHWVLGFTGQRSHESRSQQETRYLP